MKREIGILTFWGIPNYGGFAQAYALNHVVSTICPQANVYTMAYLHPSHKEIYCHKRKFPKLSSPKDLTRLRFYKDVVFYFADRDINYPHFERDWNLIPHKALVSEISLEKYKWDIVITGSDAIWEYCIPAFGDDIHLIGDQLNCNKLISYAASFGAMNPEDIFAPFIGGGVKRYDAISVRDNNSRQIVEKHLGQNMKIPIVLDPTLLHDFKNDPKIPLCSWKKYILIYGNTFPERLVDSVKKYALKHDLKLLGAGCNPVWCDKGLTKLTPKQWIGMFKNAEFVITCTFHGLMFSLNYEKKVIFYQEPLVKNRSEGLLEQIGLMPWNGNVTSVDEVLSYEWDYKKINQRLSDIRADSMDFLRRELIHG